MLQKQVQTFPVDQSNNSKMEDKIILLSFPFGILHLIKFGQIFLKTTPKLATIKKIHLLNYMEVTPVTI